MSVGLSGGDKEADDVGRKDELAPVGGILEPKAVTEVGVHKVIFHFDVCFLLIGLAPLVESLLDEKLGLGIAKTDI
jgi:hypothetical protein